MWAGTAGKLELPEPRHPTEAESVPPGFTPIQCIQHKTPEEQEAIAKYETPSEIDRNKAIDEELGIQDITAINESWYRPSEAEVASAVESILDESQPMEVDQAPELLGTGEGSSSPMTVGEDKVVNTPASFSRAPGDGRPSTVSLAGATSRKIMGRTEREGPVM